MPLKNQLILVTKKLKMIKEFSQSVTENIGSYVYCLIDPTKNEIFYIGKGKGNRVFNHLKLAIETPTKSDKFDRIREIREKGEEPKHFIIRYALTDKEASTIESVLIDFARLNEDNRFSLSNLIKGSGSNEFGIRTIDDIYHKYGAEEITIIEPSLIIVINRHFWYGIPPDKLYEVTRMSWKSNKKRIESVKYVFAVYFGIVREVYEVERWLEVFDEHSKKMRNGFEGKIAPEEIRGKYLNQSANKYKSNGNPIRFVNC